MNYIVYCTFFFLGTVNNINYNKENKNVYNIDRTKCIEYVNLFSETRTNLCLPCASFDRHFWANRNPVR